MQSFPLIKKNLSVSFVVLRGGGGHYTTYHALRLIIQQQKLPWKISVTFADTIAERLGQANKSLDIYKLFGTTSDEFYDWILQNGWTWFYVFLMRLNKLLIKINYEAGVKILEEDWHKQQPDLVVSVVPFFNKALWESLQRVKPGTPLVTILTDFADCPSHYWIEPETENYVVCPTQKAVEQARDLGVDKKHIIKTSGLVVQPHFYQPQNLDRRIERQRLGLEPDCLTGLVLFGANGSQEILEIAKRLEKFPQIQLIFLCGRNQKVASTLSENQLSQKRFVTTFTEEIPYYMHLADFFIGKAGNVSISEALVMNLPVIVERNFATLPQEKYAAQWIQENEVGLTIPSFKKIDKAVEKFIQSENFHRYRENVAAFNNRAVFEIPNILNNILSTQEQRTATDNYLSKSNSKVINK